MFTEQVRREQMQTVFLEYAWDMAWCDPCAVDPLSHDEPWWHRLWARG